MSRVGQAGRAAMALPSAAVSGEVWYIFLEEEQLLRRGGRHPDHGQHIVSDHPVDAVWHLREVSPETTAPLTDLEQMVYGVTNQQVTEHGVSFDLGVLEHFRPLEQRRITATVHYDPHSATCTPSVQTTIHGQVAALERIYVQADERLVRPKVRHIDVVGKSLESRSTHVVERIAP